MSVLKKIIAFKDSEIDALYNLHHEDFPCVQNACFK